MQSSTQISAHDPLSQHCLGTPEPMATFCNLRQHARFIGRVREPLKRATPHEGYPMPTVGDTWWCSSPSSVLSQSSHMEHDEATQRAEDAIEGGCRGFPRDSSRAPQIRYPGVGSHKVYHFSDTISDFSACMPPRSGSMHEIASLRQTFEMPRRSGSVDPWSVP